MQAALRGLVLLAMTGCSQSAATAPRLRQPSVVLMPAEAPEVWVTVEVAGTDEERQRGLMYRERLATDAGMLFLFERPQPLSFWMRNTYISLDMIFIGTDRRVVGVVERAEPLTDDPRQVPGQSQFVLEVPGGWAAAHRIGPGTLTRFIDVDVPSGGRK